MSTPIPSAERPAVDRDDIAALMGEDSITEAQYQRANRLLDMLWLFVQLRKPCPEAYVLPTWLPVLGTIVADMLNNPKGYTSEAEEAYSYTLGAAAQRRVGDLSDADLALIWGGCAVSTGPIFTITTYVPAWP